MGSDSLGVIPFRRMECRRFGGRRSDIFRRGGGGAGEVLSQLREIEIGGVAFDGKRRHIVGASRHFRRGESPEPYSRLLPRLANFRHPFPPIPHPYSPICWAPPIIHTIRTAATLTSLPTLTAVFCCHVR